MWGGESGNERMDEERMKEEEQESKYSGEEEREREKVGMKREEREKKNKKVGRERWGGHNEEMKEEGRGEIVKESGELPQQYA